jgi:hypothetical protein
MRSQEITIWTRNPYKRENTDCIAIHIAPEAAVAASPDLSPAS